MKKFQLLIFLLLGALSLQAQESIMTYNIRYSTPNDGVNWWEYRKLEVADMIKRYQPDILGIQEGLNNQVAYLDSVMSNYRFIGVGRDDGAAKGEYTAIFYNTESIDLIASETYWLSETPDRVSVGWDASMERIVTYGKFKDKTSGKLIHVFNCHYDHIGETAREKSSELILKIIKNKGIEAEQIAVIGDFNSLPESVPITTLKTKFQDSFEISQSKPKGPVGTFNGFNAEEKLVNRIDYIFIRNLQVSQYIAIEDRRTNNLMLSDHMPILIMLK